MSDPSRPDRLAIVGFLEGPHAVSRLIATLVRGIVDAGVEVDLLLPPAPPSDTPDLGCAVGIFPLQSGDDRAALGQLRAYLRERSPLAILTNRDRASALLARLDAGERPRTVLRIGTNVIEKLRKEHLFARRKARRQLTETFARADALVGISDGGCAALRELFAGREAPPIHRIYNCIDALEVARLSAEPVTHPWLAEKDKPVVLSVGRLVGVKDYPTLIRAFGHVRKRMDCRLIIAGEGRQRGKLETLIGRLGLRGSVDLPGFAPNPFALMKQADVFVLSSVFEGFGNVLTEALAAGLPCVATDCRSGPREILADGKYGRLARVGDPLGLADAIVATLTNPPSAELLREAVQRFTPEAAVAEYLRVLGLTPLPDR
jgi:glycosyltransferase involved in cell wall biosynthesis